MNPDDELLEALRLERFGRPVPEFHNVNVDAEAEAAEARSGWAAPEPTEDEVA